MLDVTFDTSAIKVDEVQAFYAANRSQDYEAMSALFARVVTKCPEEWGPQTEPGTYSKLPMFDTFLPLIRQFVEAANAPAASFDRASVEFDLSRVTAKAMGEFFQANRTANYGPMCEVLAQVVMRCPESWGAPDKPETYHTLHYTSQFAPVVNAFVQRITERLRG